MNVIMKRSPAVFLSDVCELECACYPCDIKDLECVSYACEPCWERIAEYVST